MYQTLLYMEKEAYVEQWDVKDSIDLSIERSNSIRSSLTANL